MLCTNIEDLVSSWDLITLGSIYSQKKCIEESDLLITQWILIALRCFWYCLKGLLKGFWWPFRSLKSVKYSWSYGLNEVCDIIPPSWFELHWEVISFLVNSEDIPAAFCLHYIDFPQVPICHLLDCILSIWQGICFFYVSVTNLESSLPPILPDLVSRLVVGVWISVHGL